MIINILETEFNGFFKTIEIDESDLHYNNCPICGNSNNSILLSRIETRVHSSLENSFCKTCEHRYISRGPSIEWFQRFYASTFDNGEYLKKDIKSTLMNYKLAWKLIEVFRNLKYKITGIPYSHHLLHTFPFLIGVIDTDYKYLFADKTIKRVLEIGCGYGGMLSVFKNKGYDVYGIEGSKQRAKYCNIRGLTVFSDGDDENYKKLSTVGKFDFIYSLHVFEHIPNPDYHMQKISELISQNGWIYIQVPHYNIYSENNFIMQCHQIDHCQTFSLRSLTLLLNKYNFSVKRVRIDDSIYILAQKEKAMSRNTYSCYSANIKNTISEDMLIDGLDEIRANFAQQLQATWGSNSPYKIVDIKDDKVLYERKNIFNLYNDILANAKNDKIKFLAEDDGKLFPVKFAYNNDGKATICISSK